MIHTRSKCLTHDTCRVNNRVLPTSIMLNEVTRKTDKTVMTGTTETAVWNADEHVTNSIVFLVCDHTPVGFLSTFMDSICWETCTKKYDVNLNKKSILPFF